ncbi:mesoderm induction early response protein 1 [Topomyia yanbarensis]|uniref:mesoderm induction early response protein 1 n=1 Tax=Topomyia yanbarensis TaxID=2498891 RepID=UPI00273C0372|nr:mesoderm induction early response protein 1 [Topomyia yanbarensis]XP_058816119.1 mesoderm induction early response protein 1 [Topomyia yanbarensis]XP_058816120.1 mesoderm induction early response protein 1 [Topomyia yanbarensis]XP_058816121.1 mesoderm induction early response protein 1 [Topomyia yanbarensis]
MPIDEAQQKTQQQQQTQQTQSQLYPTDHPKAPSKPRLNEDEEEDEDDEDDDDDDDDGAGTGGDPTDGARSYSSTQVASTGGGFFEEDEEDEEDEIEEHSELRQLFAPIIDAQAQSEDEEDGDYIPDEEVKKTIMVGSDFQAAIPEGLCRYDDALPYENEDKLLWNPTVLNEDLIEEYLLKIANGASSNTGNPQTNSVFSIPLGKHLRDDEQGLYLLQQCGHNIDEALRRKRIHAVPVAEQQMSIWSEEECRNFENGLRIHGKDFHMIQQSKVRTRSVGELVQFYYLWKKTERHDLFASKTRLEKKKYNLHPGLTDHMDRFLEEQENSTGFGDRSSSPGFNSLYSGTSEAKRSRLMDSKASTGSSKRSSSAL